MDSTIQVPGFMTATLAIIVFFAGMHINARVTALRDWNIPDAVTGGLLAALVTLGLKTLGDVELKFDLGARDLLLLYFFSGVGLNARLADLMKGGRPFLILLVLTVVFLFVQDGVAVGAGHLLGLPDGISVLLGSAALIGGHGTVLAWTPIITDNFGLTNAAEVGIASATMGLVLGSLVGGPVARTIINREKLAGTSLEAAPVVGLSVEQEQETGADITHVGLMRTILVLNLVILVAYTLEEIIDDFGIRLPLFLLCMLTAIIITNVVPRLAPRYEWPAGSRALALISELCLSVFLCMSLMSMQLWALEGLGFSIILVLAVQTLVTALYTMFAVYPLMGRNYDAAVLSSGFVGIALGATPTAIANMSAVTKTHGPSTMPFIVLPLVSAFFIDIVNAFVITYLTAVP
ncbi:sodium/glutamate symporter [Segnochrobactraceae bacterium EtOH-i3]